MRELARWFFQSMIPKSMPLDLIRGWQPVPEKIMLN